MFSELTPQQYSKIDVSSFEGDLGCRRTQSILIQNILYSMLKIYLDLKFKK